MRRKRIDDGRIYGEMNRLMREKRLFLQKGFSRDDMAREVMTNRTYVSRALRGRGLNFSQFVNAFRAQYAIELLLDPENAALSQEDVAEMSGFSSADAMNRYVKKSAGTTACAVRKRLKGA